MIDFGVAQGYNLNVSSVAEIGWRCGRGETRKMRRARLTILLLLLPATCTAAGWSPYEIAIGDGYSILVCTEGSSCVKDGGAVLLPGNYRGIVPCIVKYATTERHILAEAVRTTGDRPAASRAGRLWVWIAVLLLISVVVLLATRRALRNAECESSLEFGMRGLTGLTPYPSEKQIRMASTAMGDRIGQVRSRIWGMQERMMYGPKSRRQEKREEETTKNAKRETA
jgi:hypothetical protein